MVAKLAIKAVYAVYIGKSYEGGYSTFHPASHVQVYAAGKATWKILPYDAYALPYDVAA